MEVRVYLFLTVAVLIAAVSVPLILHLIPPNRAYGFRVKETLASKNLWYAVNQFTGWSMLIGSIIFALIIIILAKLPSLQHNLELFALLSCVTLIICIGCSIIASAAYFYSVRDKIY